MKKSFSLIIIMIALFVFSSTAFAGDDGNMSSPGKNCPQGTTCIAVNSDIPINTEATQKAWYQELFDFLF